MAIMVGGTVLIRSRCSINRALGDVALVDRDARPVNDSAMDLDELFPGKPDDPLTLLTHQDLDPMSVEELHSRIAALEAEIARCKARIETAVSFRASADAIFRK
jgi:uncharacterized small protein (DUF1192 family)